MTKPVTVPPRAVKPGDNIRSTLMDITMSAARYGFAHDELVSKIAAFADNPNGALLAQLQDAVAQGYVAYRVAKAAGANAATFDHIATAALILAKAGHGAKQAKRAGIRTEEEERMCGSARALWHKLNVKAGTAQEAGTGKGRSAGGKASAAKRKARAVTATIGATDVTISRAKAPKAPKAPQAQPVGKPVTPLEAMAHVHTVAATLMLYLEANAAQFIPAVLAKANKACATLRALPVPTH